MSIFKPISFFLKRTHTGAPADPVRDWLVLLSLSTVALVSIIVWNAWAFDTIANGGTIGISTESAPVGFNQSSLDTIRGVFANRAAEEARYATGIYRFTDPSL